MELARISAAVASTALVIGYAVGSRLLVTTGDVWYRSLERPPWQPPGVVIGIIWPYNFAALIAAGIAVALIASAVLTVPIVVAAWNTRTWAGAILLPYNVWVALAASLSVDYAIRN